MNVQYRVITVHGIYKQYKFYKNIEPQIQWYFFAKSMKELEFEIQLFADESLDQKRHF